MAPMAKETKQKGNLTMDPMVESSWQSKEYSTPTKEKISLVWKMVEMLGTTLGGFVSRTARVRQMTLDALPRYLGNKQPGGWVWLTQMECYMRLMCYGPTDWLDVVAM